MMASEKGIGQKYMIGEQLFSLTCEVALPVKCEQLLVMNP